MTTKLHRMATVSCIDAHRKDQTEKSRGVSAASKINDDAKNSGHGTRVVRQDSTLPNKAPQLAQRNR